MNGSEWLCLAVGTLTGAGYTWLRPGGLLDTRVRLQDTRERLVDALREIHRLSNHPAGRQLPENVVPLRGLRVIGGGR